LFAAIFLFIFFIFKPILYKYIWNRYSIDIEENKIELINYYSSSKNDKLELLKDSNKEMILVKDSSKKFFIKGFSPSSSLSKRTNSIKSKTTNRISRSNPNSNQGWENSYVDWTNKAKSLDNLNLKTAPEFSYQNQKKEEGKFYRS
jgi:hypothetical protein